MNIKLSQIAQDFKDSGVIQKLIGSDQEISSIAAVESFESNDLIFVGNKKLFKSLGTQRPGAVVTTTEFLPAFEKTGTPVLLSENVNLAQALIKQKYLDRDYSLEGWEDHHPTAVIHKTAKIAKNVRIGPFVTIAAGCSIGENTNLLSHVCIEHNVSIGKNCTIHPQAFIGYNSEIGEGVIIKQGAVLGSEGFGFAQDEKKKNHRIPQIGRVVIGDRAVIGASNCIERAAYTITKIGSGTVMDSLCHIAHGVQTGEDCILMAQTVIAGSTTLGNRVITSGQTGILDHLNICDDVILLHRAGVSRDIKEPGLYAYLPLMPLPTYLKSSLQFASLHELKKKIAQLEKKLDDNQATI